MNMVKIAGVLLSVFLPGRRLAAWGIGGCKSGDVGLLNEGLRSYQTVAGKLTCGNGGWSKDKTQECGEHCIPETSTTVTIKMTILLFSWQIGSDFVNAWTQHARLPSPSPPIRVCSNSCPVSWWCHARISSSVVPFSSHLQSFPASWTFPVSQPFASNTQRMKI